MFLVESRMSLFWIVLGQTRMSMSLQSTGYIPKSDERKTLYCAAITARRAAFDLRRNTPSDVSVRFLVFSYLETSSRSIALMEEITQNVAGEINELHNENLGFGQKT